MIFRQIKPSFFGITKNAVISMKLTIRIKLQHQQNDKISSIFIYIDPL